MAFFSTLITWCRRILITIWFWAWTSIATVLLQVAVLVFGAADHDGITALIENLMANMIFLAMTLPGIWSFNSYKTKNVNREDYEASQGPFLLAANHNSIVDTLFMALLPIRKSYTFNLKWSWVPIFGPLCLQANYVGIDVSNPDQKAKVVPNIVAKMKAGYSIMIYPQGSRAANPLKRLEPADLKHGTFTIAKQGEFKILPIAIRGTDTAMRRGGWCDVSTIDLIICKPFAVTDVEQGKRHYCDLVNAALGAK
jgi:1-acyl-sn-glycerol-3-phosphate acyltransferase